VLQGQLALHQKAIDAELKNKYLLNIWIKE